MGELRVEFLEDGTRAAESVAADVVAFVEQARRSLEVAIYDFDAREGPTAAVADALESAKGRGVAVRVVFNREPSEHPADPRPMQGTPDAIDGLDVPTRGVDGHDGLMHHKYIVRDAESVWTGSMNWTADSFARQENVIMTVDARELATAFLANFERLWKRSAVERSGAEGAFVLLDHGVRVRAFFSPHPPFLGHVAAGRIVEANRRIRILSPVLTSGAVLGTLCEHIVRKKLDVGGVYDHTQMEDVQRQWGLVPHNHWKIEAWKTIAPFLVGKVSTRYRPDALHDYMHAKAVVVDDEVLAGSYNLSKHGEGNAENVLHVVSEHHADRFAEFADRVAARYAVASA